MFPSAPGLPDLVTAPGGLIAMLTAFLSLQYVPTKLSSANASRLAIPDFDSDGCSTLAFSSCDARIVILL